MSQSVWRKYPTFDGIILDDNGTVATLVDSGYTNIPFGAYLLGNTNYRTSNTILTILKSGYYHFNYSLFQDDVGTITYNTFINGVEISEHIEGYVKQLETNDLFFYGSIGDTVEIKGTCTPSTSDVYLNRTTLFYLGA